MASAVADPARAAFSAAAGGRSQRDLFLPFLFLFISLSLTLSLYLPAPLKAGLSLPPSLVRERLLKDGGGTSGILVGQILLAST